MYVLYLLFASCCAGVLAAPKLSNSLSGQSDNIGQVAGNVTVDDLKTAVPKYNIEDAYNLFINFIETYGKNYSSETEKAMRFDQFKNNLIQVNQLNDESDSAIYAISKYMDLSSDEFKKNYTGLKVDTQHMNDYPEFRADYNYCKYVRASSYKNKTAPASLDYRDKGCVTSVKNQGSCGSCYAFVATEILESQHCLTNGVLVDLAPQQIVDCDRTSAGCNGGVISESIRNNMDMGGMMKEKNYPYTAKDPKESGKNCQFRKKNVEAIPNGCFNMNLRDQNEVKTMLNAMGPLGIAVPAAWGLQFYTGGVINSCRGQHDHAMFLVGYGKEKGEDVFIVKNSWGEDWGDNGYCYISSKSGSKSCEILNYRMSAGSVKKNK